jgi:hypothetical protein
MRQHFPSSDQCRELGKCHRYSEAFETPTGSCPDRIKAFTYRSAILVNLGPLRTLTHSVVSSPYAFKVPTANQTLIADPVIRVSAWPKMVIRWFLLPIPNGIWAFQ